MTGLDYGDAMLSGVYFPNITTYFHHPHMAQNVHESFSASPLSAPNASFNNEGGPKPHSAPNASSNNQGGPQPDSAPNASSPNEGGPKNQFITEEPGCVSRTAGHGAEKTSEGVECSELVSGVVCPSGWTGNAGDQGGVGDGAGIKSLHAPSPAAQGSHASVDKAGDLKTLKYSSSTERVVFSSLSTTCKGEDVVQQNHRQHQQCDLGPSVAASSRRSVNDKICRESRQGNDDDGVERERRQVFFTQPGSTIMFDFFQVLADNKVSGKLACDQLCNFS